MRPLAVRWFTISSKNWIWLAVGVRPRGPSVRLWNREELGSRRAAEIRADRQNHLRPLRTEAMAHHEPETRETRRNGGKRVFERTLARGGIEKKASGCHTPLHEFQPGRPTSPTRHRFRHPANHGGKIPRRYGPAHRAFLAQKIPQGHRRGLARTTPPNPAKIKGDLGRAEKYPTLLSK